jgi:NitT/TauT family transport system substrate-binding protein
LIFPVADQEGFYAEHNVQLDEVTSFGGGGTTIRGVVTGGIPVAGGSAAGAANSFTAGAPVHIIANVDEPPPIDVVTLADSDIESIQDLQGKKVGFTNPGSVSQQLLAGSIARADGISLDDVTLQAMGGLGETITGINEGIIDAGWSNITVSIPKVQAGDWKRIYGTWEYITIPNLVLLAGQQTIEEQPEMLQGIVDAHANAGDFYRNNTDAVASMWADLYDNVDQDLALQVLEKKIEISDVGVWTNGMQKDTIDQLEQAMQLSGMVDEEESLPWEDILDQQFLSDEEKIDF